MVKVMVVMGGPSSEHAVSLASGATVAHALGQFPELYRVQCLTITRDGEWRVSDRPPDHAIVAGLPRVHLDRAKTLHGLALLAEADVAFLALHGSFGEDGTIQSVMECLGIAYTGSGPLASALAMDKKRAKECFRAHHIPVPQQYEHTPGGRNTRAWPFPLVVKPNRGGSSVGVARVEDRDELEAALAALDGEDALIEECIVGREFTCAVLESESGEVSALPVVEIRPRHGRLFDFAAKYDEAGAEEICPAPIAPSMAGTIQKWAQRAHRALGCEGFSRTDLVWGADGPRVLEVNTIPGMTEQSLLPKAAQAAGISLPNLMHRLVDLALARGRTLI